MLMQTCTRCKKTHDSDFFYKNLNKCKDCCCRANVYTAMKKRCHDEDAHDYDRYGGKGVRVCGEWLSSYRVFEQWLFDNNWKHGLEIDRIDGTKGYAPDNCQLITRRENNRKRCNAKLNKEDVLEIKRLLKEGNMTQVAVAKQFNIGAAHVSRIHTGRMWADIIL